MVYVMTLVGIFLASVHSLKTEHYVTLNSVEKYVIIEAHVKILMEHMNVSVKLDILEKTVKKVS